MKRGRKGSFDDELRALREEATAAGKSLRSVTSEVGRFESALKGGLKQLSGNPLAAPLTNNVAEVKKTLENMGTDFLGGNFQSSMSSLFGGGAGGFVGDVRDTLGGLTARDRATQTLQGLARNVSGDPNWLRTIFPAVLENEERMEKAERTARDIAADKASSDLGDTIYDFWEKVLNGGKGQRNR